MSTSTSTTAKGLSRRNFFLPDTRYDAMKQIAAKRGTTAADLMRQAVEEFISRDESNNKG